MSITDFLALVAIKAASPLLDAVTPFLDAISPPAFLCREPVKLLVLLLAPVGDAVDPQRISLPLFGGLQGVVQVVDAIVAATIAQQLGSCILQDCFPVLEAVILRRGRRQKPPHSPSPPDFVGPRQEELAADQEVDVGVTLFAQIPGLPDFRVERRRRVKGWLSSIQLIEDGWPRVLQRPLTHQLLVSDSHFIFALFDFSSFRGILLLDLIQPSKPVLLLLGSSLS